MMEIKPIETHYKGYRFRSRLEARWAVFFDAAGIDWEYEKEGYELQDGTRYLPDFWLPGLSMFVEVKGVDPTKEEIEKCNFLKKITGNTVLLVSGMPGPDCGSWGFSLEKSMGLARLVALFIYSTDFYKSARAARFEFGESG